MKWFRWPFVSRRYHDDAVMTLARALGDAYAERDDARNQAAAARAALVMLAGSVVPPRQVRKFPHLRLIAGGGE